MKYPSISRAEDLIRRVVEEPFSWLSGGKFDPYQLAKQLTKQFIEPVTDDDRPNTFLIYIHPNDFARIESDIPTMEEQVADYVNILSERMGASPARPVTIIIKSDSDQDSLSARIEAKTITPDSIGHTEVLPDIGSDSVLNALRAVDAFLIVQGRRHVALDQPVIRIGRRIDNDIVLDSPSVSREHAQIRWRQRYFVIYDISSQARTMVNGDVVQEHILRPGDVIALSDILLVYGEGMEDRHATDVWPQNEDIASTLLRPPSE